MFVVQTGFCRESLYVLFLSLQIDDVVGFDCCVLCGQRLGDVADETMVAGCILAYLNHVDTIVSTHVELRHCLSYYHAAWVHLIGRHTACQLVFLHKLVKSLALVAIVVRCLLFQEYPAEWQHNQYAHCKADDTHGQERKERQPLITMLAQGGVDDEVGWSSDKCEHTAHTTGKGQGHEQCRCALARLGSH